MLFTIGDHVDAQSLVDPIRPSRAAPRHVKGHVSAPAGRRIPLESLDLAAAIARDDQLDARVTALECMVENH